LRWEDDVHQDIRILEVKNWKKVALDRNEWAKLLKKASRGHQVLSKPMMMMITTYFFNI
jgi:hypothetical protein